jgi:hypothetical protein
VIRPDEDELDVDGTTFADHRRLGMTLNRLGVIRSPSKLIVRGRLVRDPAGLRHKKTRGQYNRGCRILTKFELYRRARTPRRRILLWAGELPKPQSSHCTP